MHFVTQMIWRVKMIVFLVGVVVGVAVFRYIALPMWETNK